MGWDGTVSMCWVGTAVHHDAHHGAWYRKPYHFSWIDFGTLTMFRC